MALLITTNFHGPSLSWNHPMCGTKAGLKTNAHPDFHQQYIHHLDLFDLQDFLTSNLLQKVN
jgi:hypothetical protein